MENAFGVTQAEIEQLGNKPLAAASIEEWEELMRESYNRLHALTNGVPYDPENSRILKRVSVLAKLAEPKVHILHFRFDKPALDLDSLKLDVKMYRYRDSRPDMNESQRLDSWFPYLKHGFRCGGGNMHEWGYEGVQQYWLKLSLFPNLLARVREYYGLVQAPYTSNGKEERRRLYPGFEYLCGM